jgi:hypothetical protein
MPLTSLASAIEPGGATTVTIHEFFIEPHGAADRFEVNSSEAFDLYRRLTDLIEAGAIVGDCTPASATGRALDRAQLLALIGDVQGAWYHGRQREPARGPALTRSQLTEHLATWERFDVNYFEI